MTGFEMLPVLQILSAAAAGLLYVATYLSFVRLLMYPRNWHVPTLPASLATGTLAALTVVVVALSPDGFDWTALIVSAGFIAAAFCVIGAPAIAFRPSSRPVEFLARHGDYAGLWLSGPALLAGLATSNVKLQILLFTLIAIELSWFARQRWTDRYRVLYPMNDRDLSVLMTQAKGDLVAFRKRHGIRELVLSKDSVSWNGCGRGTPPCPFNHYVNRLGLNTAPCCREHMQALSHYIAACLTQMGVVHWLEGGSLLGAVRENGMLLDWEDDIDISVLLDGDVTWEHLVTGLAERGARDGYYVDVFENKGFLAISFDPPKRGPIRWERNRLRGEIRTDIAVYRRAVSFGQAVLERQSHKGAMPATESGGFGIPEEIVLPTKTMRFVGGEFACPNQSNTYLELLYGNFRKVEYTYVDDQAAEARAGL